MFGLSVTRVCRQSWFAMCRLDSLEAAIPSYVLCGDEKKPVIHAVSPLQCSLLLPSMLTGHLRIWRSSMYRIIPLHSSFRLCKNKQNLHALPPLSCALIHSTCTYMHVYRLICISCYIMHIEQPHLSISILAVCLSVCVCLVCHRRA